MKGANRSSRSLASALGPLVLLGCALGMATGPAPAQAGAGSRADSADDDPHVAALQEERYPAATVCRTCHPDHYREWSASPHAYAQISPVFNAMHGTLLKETSGTLGDFCIRCHTPVGMALGEPLFTTNAERAPVSREGVTCIVCHRIDRPYGKNSGRGAVRPGEIFDPVYGPRDDEELRRVLASPDEYGTLVTEPGRTGRRIHSEARYFAPISGPGFCGSCHDVTLVNGLRLEEAFSEYRQSPAAARGETCQDCHMGLVPGTVSGYAEAPAADVGGVPTRPRKRTSHSFVGPDYPVVHPGIYPQSPEAADFATPEEWITFDVDAGWGTDEFEDAVGDDVQFPERWAWPEERYEAREIVERQLALRAEAHQLGTVLLRKGYQLGEIELLRASERGIAFDVEVRNGTDGHSVPTGFVAERVVFLRVTVTDAAGDVIFRSGDLDPNGDLRDQHSLYVHHGELPLDDQLFNLQSKFVTRNERGGEREQVLAVNYSLDPLPFVRPDTSPSILLGRTLSARIHKQGIPPSASRRARYEVAGSALTGRPPYVVYVELVAGMIPPNLVDAIKDVGFDYGMSARDVAAAVVAGHRVLWARTLEIEGE